MVLELLAAVCLVRGGHEKIMKAVDSFKVQQRETHRFEKLVQVFKESGMDNPEFAVCPAVAFSSACSCFPESIVKLCC
jgi:hypothetical protein